jgi:ABC-type Fe3+ transport system permease subunit
MKAERELLALALIVIIAIAGILLFLSIEKINSLAALVNVKQSNIKEEINMSLLFSILAVAVIVICAMILIMILLKKK